MSTALPSGDRSRRTLFVGGLEVSVTLNVLQAAFIPFGPLLDVQIPLDHVTGLSKGFGFVEFQDEKDCTEALENMNGSELFGRVLKVNLAKPQVNKAKPVWAEADEWYSGLKAGADAEADGK